MCEETIEKIKEEYRIRNHSDLSCKQYVYHVSCFLKWIGDKPLDELTLADARITLFSSETPPVHPPRAMASTARFPSSTASSRFLLHVLPFGLFVKIRYYGLLACRCKKEKVALCRKLLGCRGYQSELRGKTAAEKIKILFGRDIRMCSRCGEKLNTFFVKFEAEKLIEIPQSGK